MDPLMSIFGPTLVGVFVLVVFAAIVGVWQMLRRATGSRPSPRQWEWDWVHDTQTRAGHIARRNLIAWVRGEL